MFFPGESVAFVRFLSLWLEIFLKHSVSSLEALGLLSASNSCNFITKQKWTNFFPNDLGRVPWEHSLRGTKITYQQHTMWTLSKDWSTKSANLIWPPTPFGISVPKAEDRQTCHPWPSVEILLKVRTTHKAGAPSEGESLPTLCTLQVSLVLPYPSLWHHQL